MSFASLSPSPKWMSLFALVFQEVSLLLMIRYSMVRPDYGKEMGEPSLTFITSTAIVMSECIKVVLNFCIEFFQQKHKYLHITSDTSRNKAFVSDLRNEIFSKECLKLAVPATLYLIQNRLLFVALANLSIPEYQITIQGKLLATALCSTLILRKRISCMQYLSLLLLALGVGLVELSNSAPDETEEITHMLKDDQFAVASAGHNHTLGLLAVLFSCFTSAFAGVYFEKILKGTKDTNEKVSSVYIRNIQLAGWSIILGCLSICATRKDLEQIWLDGFFQGYNLLVVGIVINQAVVGLTVSLAMKYGDNILKGFAVSVSIVVATPISVLLFRTKIKSLFLIGALLVLCAIALYGRYPANNKNNQKSCRNHPITMSQKK